MISDNWLVDGLMACVLLSVINIVMILGIATWVIRDGSTLGYLEARVQRLEKLKKEEDGP